MSYKREKTPGMFDLDDLEEEYENMMFRYSRYEYLFDQDFDMTGSIYNVENGKLSLKDQIYGELPILYRESPRLSFYDVQGEAMIDAAFRSALFARMIDEALSIFDNRGIILKNPRELSQYLTGDVEFTDRLFMSSNSRATRKELEQALKILAGLKNSDGLCRAIKRRLDGYDWAGRVGMTGKYVYFGYLCLINRSHHTPGFDPDTRYSASDILRKNVRSKSYIRSLDEIFRDGKSPRNYV